MSEWKVIHENFHRERVREFLLLLFLFSPWYNRTGWLGVEHQITYFFFRATEIADYETHKECITGLEAERYCQQQSLCDLAHTQKGGFHRHDCGSSTPSIINYKIAPLVAVMSSFAAQNWRSHVDMSLMCEQPQYNESNQDLLFGLFCLLLMFFSRFELK